MEQGDDGLYRLTVELPAGEYEFKVALDGDWTVNYGSDGAQDGPNYTLSLDSDSTVTFTYDPEKEGAVQSDTEESGTFSFELPPSEAPKKEQGDATTEVEARPEGAPPSSSPPPSETAPVVEPEGPPSEPGGEPEPPAADEGEAPPPESVEPSARSSSRKRSRVAAYRRARSGSLVYVDNDGTTGLSVPFVDVRPTYISMKNTFLTPRTGIEVLVPILRVDLP